MKLYFAVALMVLLAAVAVSARPGGRGVSSRHFLSLLSMLMHHHHHHHHQRVVWRLRVDDDDDDDEIVASLFHSHDEWKHPSKRTMTFSIIGNLGGPCLPGATWQSLPAGTRIPSCRHKAWYACRSRYCFTNYVRPSVHLSVGVSHCVFCI